MSAERQRDLAPVRVGVIGLGMVSAAHLDGYQTSPACELVVVCDADEARTARVAAERGVPGTSDYHEVLADESVDAVALLLPHPLHHEVAREALVAGKHVCVEKPLTVTGQEACELVKLARERRLKLAVAENTRYVDAYVEAERLVREGDLGEIRLVRGFIPDQILDEWADRSDPTQDWKREPFGCGAIIDCAPHMLYLLVWLFGDVAELQTFARDWVSGIELENHAVIAGRMASGPLFSLELCSLTEYPRGERVEIYGSEGSLIIDQVLDPPMVLYRNDRDVRGTPVARIAYDLAGWKRRSIMGTASDFVEAILADREPAVGPEDGRYVVRLVERAYESAARGGLAVPATRPDGP